MIDWVDGLPDGAHESYLLDGHELRAELGTDEKRPTVLEFEPLDDVRMPLTPRQLGWKPSFIQVDECRRFGDGPCDRWAIFDPRGSDAGLCAAHLSRAGRMARQDWVDAILEAIMEGDEKGIYHQSLRMAGFEGNDNDDRLEFPHGTIFSSCDLTGSRFLNCILRGAFFEGNTMLRSALFENVDLSNGKFTMDAALEKAEFNNCNLSFCTFTGGSMTKTTLSQSDLRGANFGAFEMSALVMNDVDFSHCRMKDVTMASVYAKNCKFGGAKVTGQISGSIFVESDLTNLNFGPDLRFRQSVLKNCEISSSKERSLVEAEKRDQVRLVGCKFVDREPPPLPERLVLETPEGAAEALARLEEMCEASLRRIDSTPELHASGWLREGRHGDDLAGFIAMAFISGLVLDAAGVAGSWGIGACAGAVGAVANRYLSRAKQSQDSVRHA